MKTYVGKRVGLAVVVTVDGRRLKPRLDLFNHSPTGFEWGYGGSGPAQLALAILADHCTDTQEALNLHQRFKWSVVAELPDSGWRLDSWDIDAAIDAIRSKEAPCEEAEAD
jgi:hypothetical protein